MGRKKKSESITKEQKLKLLSIQNKNDERNAELKGILKEMLDADDKGFTNKEIWWLETFYKKDHFSFHEEKIICDIYKQRM